MSSLIETIATRQRAHSADNAAIRPFRVSVTDAHRVIILEGYVHGRCTGVARPRGWCSRIPSQERRKKKPGGKHPFSFTRSSFSRGFIQRIRGRFSMSLPWELRSRCSALAAAPWMRALWPEAHRDSQTLDPAPM